MAIGGAMVLLVAGCSSGMDGTFENELGARLEFHGDGTVVQTSIMGVQSEMKYEVDGNKIKVAMGNGTNVLLTRIDDDTLGGPMDTKFKRVQ